ncbi:MAG: hypothetical protein A2X34_01775 [Elusimicrobia bacterium GWC2_51_8]|nr:MAG: hypothetical protein A2X33_11530 [Elusimicrobia bacterium GWA2_51_34]OGR66170.1 MAG: hypothetical protein A2X34_01775 [Elusimicrobia bacterium GWC2_51_8]OGR85973.1 MAG: hypothetical protein A2021_03540 [Elusimicrobia bacterium GWF2_52_66]HCE97303.1 hypothetical protein [Elusimicrobiota bacterium]
METGYLPDLFFPVVPTGQWRLLCRYVPSPTIARRVKAAYPKKSFDSEPVFCYNNTVVTETFPPLLLWRVRRRCVAEKLYL